MSTANKLNKLLNTKQAIKQAIVDKGVEIGDDVKFADYPSKIESIVAEGANPYFETLWNYITNNGVDYSYLFYGYNGTILDTSKLDTSNVKDMSYMFQRCNQITELDVSNWDTSNVNTMSYMFSGCYGLTELDVSNFDTSNVTNMNNMFVSCENLTTLDLSNWDTSDVTSMSTMFQACGKLTTLDVSNFDTSDVTSMSTMFQNCKSLTTLDLSNWDVSKCTGSSSLGNYIFAGCSGLTNFKSFKNISGNISFSSCTALSHESLMSIINNLKTVTSTKTLTLGTTNLAKLTADEVAIATNKGWTVK